MLVAFALILLVGWFFGRSERIYDERYHLERVDQIVAGRPWMEVFSEPTPSAVGPVFPLVQSAVAVLSKDVRAARLLIMVAAVGVGFLAVRLGRATTGRSSPAVLLLGAGPFLVSSMLALTEILSVLFVLGAFVLIWVGGVRSLRLCASGVMLALAALSRQTSFIFLLPLAVAWLLAERITLRELLLLAVPSCAALALLLSLWGGMLPPGQHHLGGGYAFRHALEGLIYSAVIGCSLNPGFVVGKIPLVIIGVAVLANAVFGFFREPVLLTLFPRGSNGAEILARTFFGAGIGLTVVFFFQAGKASWTERRWTSLVWLGCVALVGGSCGLITTQFSSRYVVAAIPFLFLIASSVPNPLKGRAALAIAFVGFLLGLNALRGYGLWAK